MIDDAKEVYIQVADIFGYDVLDNKQKMAIALAKKHALTSGQDWRSHLPDEHLNLASLYSHEEMHHHHEHHGKHFDPHAEVSQSVIVYTHFIRLPSEHRIKCNVPLLSISILYLSPTRIFLILCNIDDCSCFP